LFEVRADIDRDAASHAKQRSSPATHTGNIGDFHTSRVDSFAEEFCGTVILLR